jgi:hypothetical protein
MKFRPLHDRPISVCRGAPHRDQHRQAAGAGETAAIESPGQRGPGPSLSSSDPYSRPNAQRESNEKPRPHWRTTGAKVIMGCVVTDARLFGLIR